MVLQLYKNVAYWRETGLDVLEKSNESYQSFCNSKAEATKKYVDRLQKKKQTVARLWGEYWRTGSESTKQIAQKLEASLMKEAGLMSQELWKQLFMRV